MESINLKDPSTLIGVAGLGAAVCNVMYTNNQVSALLEQISSLSKRLESAESKIALLQNSDSTAKKKITSFEKHEKERRKVIEKIIENLPKNDRKNVLKGSKTSRKQEESDSEEEHGVDD